MSTHPNLHVSLGTILSRSDTPFAQTRIIKHCELGGKCTQFPKVSFVTPVHNHESVIAKNLESTRSHASLPHEFIVIADDCSDGSLARILSWANQATSASELTTRIVVLETGSSIFETACDALGVSFAQAEVIIEIQADMELQQTGFDERLCNILSKYVDIFSVSGRALHPFEALQDGIRSPLRVLESLLYKVHEYSVQTREPYRASPVVFRATGRAGRLGTLIEAPAQIEQELVFVGGSAIRGPWAFRRSDYVALGGLDVGSFFLGNDDHDLNLRALLYLGKASAHTPIHFLSPLSVGATRRVKSAAQQARFIELKDHFASAQLHSALGVALDSKLPRLRRSIRKIT